VAWRQASKQGAHCSTKPRFLSQSFWECLRLFFFFVFFFSCTCICGADCPGAAHKLHAAQPRFHIDMSVPSVHANLAHEQQACCSRTLHTSFVVPRRCTHCRSRSGSRERCCACCRAHALERAPHRSTLRQGVRVCTPGTRVKILDVFISCTSSTYHARTPWWSPTTHMLLCGIFLLHQPPPPLRSFHGGHPPRAGCCAASSSRAPRGKVVGDHLTFRG
jgi:hypothetical protein